jgi:hypothetical protein
MQMTSSARRFVGVAVTAALAILGYGYWFGRTHGALYVQVDTARDNGPTTPVAPLEVTFFDADERELARAATLPPWNAIVLTSPSEYACHEIERAAATDQDARSRWQRCFARQSRWLTRWIRRARFASLQTTGCQIDRVPLEIESRADSWWIWWVPLPHIGGKPYTSFNVRIELDVANCRVVRR